MNLLRFLNKGTMRKSRTLRARARVRTFIPRLDALEDRQLLSTVVVKNSNDSGPGSLRSAIIAVASPSWSR